MRLSEDVDPRDHALGPLTSDVIVVLYADFECPFSKRAYRVAKDLAGFYGNLICIVFRHFPLAHHVNARLAAQATEAASAQGLFWEMHDCLFDNQQLLDRQHLVRYAEALGLDVFKFAAELGADLHRARIGQDIASGRACGMLTTPAFF